MKFKAIISALKSAGYEPQSYSGRGMYGKRCLGVTTKDNSAKVACSAVAEFISESYAEPDDLIDLVNELLNELGEAETDSMGLDYIVYWPDIECSADFED